MIRTPAIKHLLSLLLVVVFSGTGIVGFIVLARLREPPAAREPHENRLNVEVFRVGSENIQQTLRGFGTVRADREVILSAEVAGAVDRLHPAFEVGLSVVAPRYRDSQNQAHDEHRPLLEGDELVVIDQQRYLGQLRQIESQIAELEKEQALAETELQISEEVKKLATREFELIQTDFGQKQALHKKGVITLAELNRLELEVKQYQKNKTLADRDFELDQQRLELTTQKIATLEAQKQLLHDDFERTVIRPPFDGYISEVFVEEGQYVKPGDRLVRITNIDRVEVPVSLTLGEYDKLKPELERGARPPARLSLHEDEPPTWTGEVVRIAPEASRETRTITVFIEVDNSRQKVPLLPGTFVFSRIEGPTFKSDQYKIIPRDAVLRDRVFKVEQGIAREIGITILEKLQSVAVVKGDLKTGDLLVLTNLDVLTEGLRVEFSQPVHRLADEHDPDLQWKYYWEIVAPSKSTAETRTEPAPPAVLRETSEMTN